MMGSGWSTKILRSDELKMVKMKKWYIFHSSTRNMTKAAWTKEHDNGA